MSGVNTNVMSVNAQRNLSASTQSLATSVQRLSSGMRINSAKDDAAGLAIAERMNGQIRGMNVAIRNANDGISLVQTAEGGMASIAGSLQRIRELAVQASTSTNSTDDLKALDAEAASLMSEIDRVAKSTSFNSSDLLKGMASKNIQVGANATEVIATGAFKDVTKTGLSLDQGSGYAAAVTAATAATTAATTANTASAAAAAASAAAPNDTGLATAATTAATAATTANTANTAAQANVINLSELSLTSNAKASSALTRIDAALATVNSGRADMGALQNRLSSAISNLQTGTENLTASRGRIVDADFAVETANLSRSQVLQQAGMAMVAQANQMPQGVMALLR